MRIKFISDLHLEFHDNEFDFIFNLPTDNCDVLVIAGDLNVGFEGIKNSLEIFADHFKEQKIIYVSGNHCYYRRHRIPYLNKQLYEEVNIENVYILDNRKVTIDGVNFLGSTLWFPFDHDNSLYSYQLNDFNQIIDFEEDVYEKNKESVNFLSSNVKEGDIVITHHLPSMLCVPDDYKYSPLNRFYVCEMDEMIKRNKPKLWVFGHTHDSKDLIIGNTRLVSNPYGYLNYEVNPDFKNDFMIEV